MNKGKKDASVGNAPLQGTFGVQKLRRTMDDAGEVFVLQSKSVHMICHTAKMRGV